MKIPFKFQEIESLDYVMYQNKFKTSLKKVKTTAKSPDAALTVFINQEFEFAGNIKEALIIIGRPSGPWKKWMKDAVKANKKMTMIGKGYVESNVAGNDVFKFIHLKGDAKIEKVKKAAKTLLRKAKISLAVVQELGGLAVSEEDDEFMSELAGETTPEQEKPTDDRAAKAEEAKALIQNIAATQLDIKNYLGQIKEIAAKKDINALNALIGMILTLRDKMKKDIEVLRAMKIANAQADKFSQNLQKLTELTEQKFASRKAAIQAVEDNMTNMINSINNMIAQFGANAAYKIQL